MNILYLHQYFHLPFMNGSTRSYELARGLVENGYKVTVITSNAKGLENLPLEYEGIEIVWLDVKYDNSFSVRRRLRSFLAFLLLASYHVLKRRNYDLIYASSTPLTIIVPAILGRLLRFKPYVFEVRDLWPEIPIAMGYLKNRFTQLFSKGLVRVGYKCANTIVCLSNDMYYELIERYRIDPEKVFVLPNFSSSLYFSNSTEERPIEFPQNKKIIIYPGTFGVVNGLRYLVELAQEIRGTDLFIFCIGDGREYNEVLNLAKAKNVLNETISIQPGVAKKKVFWYIQNADFLISTTIEVPELNWNSANKYFDGICAWKPILINYLGWQADEILKSGIGIPLSRNVKQASAQLQKINDRDYEEMVQNIKELSKKYQSSAITKRLIKILANDQEISNLY